MNHGFYVWLTGQGDSAKITLAHMLEQTLLERGLRVEVLDEAETRPVFGPESGESREDHQTALRRIAFAAQLLVRNQVSVIVADRTPFRDIRDGIRNRLEGCIEVYLNRPPDIHSQGNPGQGAGEDSHIPYESPLSPDIELRIHEETPEECLDRIVRALEILKLLPASSGEGYTEEEAAAIERRLKDLGYM